MIRSNRIKNYLCLCFALLFSAPELAHSTDPWTPLQGEGSIFLSYIFESFDRFWAGNDKRDLPFGELEQQTGSLGFTYGVTDDLALDLALGYTSTDGRDLGSESGLNDSTLGVRYRLIDEFEDPDEILPSVALAGRAIIPGDYDDSGFPIAPGEKAFGAESTLLVGKLLGTSGVGVVAEIGYRLREGSVPEEFLLRTGMFYTLLEQLTLSAEFQRQQALSGIDLGTPEFNPNRARELKEISNAMQFGVGYSPSDSESYVGLFYGLTLDGRNAGDKDIFGVSISFPIL